MNTQIFDSVESYIYIYLKFVQGLYVGHMGWNLYSSPLAWSKLLTGFVTNWGPFVQRNQIYTSFGDYISPFLGQFKLTLKAQSKKLSVSNFFITGFPWATDQRVTIFDNG